MNEDPNNNPDSNSQDPNTDFRRRNRRFYRWTQPGVWLIFIGILFLLSSFGVFHGEVWGKLWPLFIIIPGLFMIFRPRRY